MLLQITQEPAGAAAALSHAREIEVGDAETCQALLTLPTTPTHPSSARSPDLHRPALGCAAIERVEDPHHAHAFF
ncbi:MAG: hypothetical protein FJ011_09270, partial [Chloroflexi bacterium]|nr:hypothetical protein [Chloroflexota bacterium]